MDLTYSLGFRLGEDGTVADSIVGGPAYRAGITAGMKVMAVDDRAFTPDLLYDALKSTKTGTQPIRLLGLSHDYYKTCTLDYQGGERYPHLVREGSKLDYLEELAKPLTAHK